MWFFSQKIYAYNPLYRWHDAGTYDAKSKTGGPNGSIRLLEELKHKANNSLKFVVDLCGEFIVLIYTVNS